MGLAYKVVTREQKELDSVSCDKCGKQIPKTSEGHWNEYGEPHSNYFEPHFDCFFYMEHSWGFSSNKDTETHKFVLCEPCYDEVFKDVKIAISNYM